MCGAPHVPDMANHNGPWNKYTCGVLYEPTEPYFNFHPELFSLNFTMFDAFGQQPEPCPTNETSAQVRPTETQSGIGKTR